MERPVPARRPDEGRRGAWGSGAPLWGGRPRPAIQSGKAQALTSDFLRGGRGQPLTPQNLFSHLHNGGDSLDPLLGRLGDHRAVSVPEQEVGEGDSPSSWLALGLSPWESPAGDGEDAHLPPAAVVSRSHTAMATPENSIKSKR